MSTHKEKTQENKGRSAGNESSQNQVGAESTFQFEDNRPETIAQRKLLKMANNNSRATQLKAFQDMANTIPQTKKPDQLPAITNNHAAPSTPTIQLYTEKDGNKVSDDGKFMVSNEGAENSTLFAKEDGPKPAAFFVEAGKDASGEMAGFKPKAKFLSEKPLAGYKEFEGPNDCGRYATALSTNESNWGDKSQLSELEQPDTKKSPYGDGFKDGKEADENPKEIDTGVGESYYMWKPPEKGDGAEMFHAATVVAKDGADTITSEADSSATYEQPVFNMYGSKTPGQSFHERYSDRFSTYEVEDFDETTVEGEPEDPRVKDHAIQWATNPEYQERVKEYQLEMRNWKEVTIPRKKLEHKENPDNRKSHEDAKITKLKKKEQ